MKTTPKRAILAFATLLASLLLPMAATAHDQDQAPDPAFAEIMQHYEAIRLALLSDSLDGVSNHGHEIHGIVEGLGGNWSPERAGVKAEKTDEAQALLPALSTAAAELAEAEDLETARTALYSLSKPLVRYRTMATGELPVVAYCPMAKRSWLQPRGEIGNPYYGQSMPGCGEVVNG